MSKQEVELLYELIIKAKQLLKDNDGGPFIPDYITVTRDEDVYTISGIHLHCYGDPTYFDDVVISH